MIVTSPPSSHILALYDNVLQNPENVDDVVKLSQALAQSGTIRPADPNAADIASSGGPSSLSTLLCPLHLVGAGFNVPKIGVGGRPAGGVDVLGTVPGYRTRLSGLEFDRVLKAANYAHAVADESWAPADGALFLFRQEQGTQAVPALAVASLLAKKVAAGVVVAGLEARVAAHGNFGATVPEARKSAELYCEVAVKLGLVPVVVLTDARVPYQPYIGRGEALNALRQILLGQVVDPWLDSHAAMCSEISSIAGSHGCRTGNFTVPQTAMSLADIMAAHLIAQGSSLSQLEDRVECIANQPRTVISAERGGFVHYDLPRIRTSLLSQKNSDSIHHRSLIREHQYPDERGMRLLSPPWQEVRRGDPVIELRSVGVPMRSVRGFFSVESIPTGQPNEILEVVAS